jgi:hypothetical protein
VLFVCMFSCMNLGSFKLDYNSFGWLSVNRAWGWPGVCPVAGAPEDFRYSLEYAKLQINHSLTLCPRNDMYHNFV